MNGQGCCKSWMTTTTNWIQPHEQWKDAPSYWAADRLTSTEANGALGHKEEVLELKAQKEPARLTSASERPQLDLDEDEKADQVQELHLTEIMRNFSAREKTEEESNAEWHFILSETLDDYFDNLRNTSSALKFKESVLPFIIDSINMNKADKQDGSGKKYIIKKPDQRDQDNGERELGLPKGPTFDIQRKVDLAPELKFDWHVQTKKPETRYLEIDELTKGWVKRLGETIDTHPGKKPNITRKYRSIFCKERSPQRFSMEN